MPLFLSCIFAAVGAGCLFSTDSFIWPIPAMLIVLAAYLARVVRVASWTVTIFSGLLALWSVWALRRALEPGGVGIIILGLTPLTQLFTIFALLLPLLLSICNHHRRDRQRRVEMIDVS